MPDENKKTEDKNLVLREYHGKVKFEVYGEEMIEKEVKYSGNSGRVYLPPDWVGRIVKIIRID
jgi:putative transposon-encoded protein